MHAWFYRFRYDEDGRARVGAKQGPFDTRTDALAHMEARQPAHDARELGPCEVEARHNFEIWSEETGR